MSILEQQYEALFTPWKIGNVEIKNRIVMCPMGGTSLFGWFELTGCHFDKEAAKLFLERANNNVGLIIPGIAPLRDTFWGKWLWQNPKMFEDLAVFMDEIHKTGAKLFIQLTAGMGRSWAITDSIVPLHKNAITRKLIKPVLDTSHELASPSPQPSRWAHDIECPEITVAQIHEIIEAFAKTAKLCKDVLADIFIRKRDKAADKGLLQLVQHDLLIVQLQFSLIRIDISEPEAGKVVRYKIQSFSGMLRILFRDRRVLHNKAQLGQCCQIRRDGGAFLLKNAADLTQLMIAVRNDPDDGEIIDRRLYLIAQQEVWFLI